MLQIHPLAFTEGKLDGMNYTLWKSKVTTILDSYELLEMMLGIDLEPQATPNLVDPTRMIPPNLDLLQAWKYRNADALCALVTITIDIVLTLIQHTSKASEDWNTLRSQYEARNQTQI